MRDRNRALRLRVIEKTPSILDPRCNSGLYGELLRAAKLIQDNQYEEARLIVAKVFNLTQGL